MADPLITVFYDGHCGLCHRFVRFLLARDRAGNKFDFAPLQGEFCAETIPAAERNRLPDSIVVRSSDGRLLVKSAAVLYVLTGIGGLWRLFAGVIGFLPQTLLDPCYDIIASVRRRLFTQPAEVCPLLPPDLRARFHD